MKFDDEEEIANWNRWLSRITPCTIGLAISLAVVIYCLLSLESSGGWSLMGLIFLPFMMGFFIAHMIVRNFFPNKAINIWAIEGIIVLLAAFIFKSFVWGA